LKIENQEIERTSTTGFFYGWIIVAASLIILLLNAATYYSFGVFIKPLQDEFGWSRALTVSAHMVFLVIYAISMFIMGRLADRYGPRFVLMGGALLVGGGFSLCSQIQTIWHMYIFLVIAAIGQGTLWSVPIATVQRWFIKKRGLVLGIITAGIGIGILIFIPIIGLLISNCGWRLTYILLGSIAWFFLTLASILMISDPKEKGLKPHGWHAMAKTNYGESIVIDEQKENDTTMLWTVGDAIRTKAFIMLVLISICGMMSINIIATHFVPFAIDI